MKLIWTNTEGNEVTLYAQGEQDNRNGEPCYVASKVQGSPYVFLAKKSACRPA